MSGLVAPVLGTREKSGVGNNNTEFVENGWEEWLEWSDE